MTEPKLKPCPFCGRRAFVDVAFNKKYVRCNHTKYCLVKPDTFLSSQFTIRKQINAWNRRSEKK